MGRHDLVEHAGPADSNAGSTGAKPPAREQKRRRPSWARPIHRVYQPDRLRCRRCGGSLEIFAYLTDTVAIARILNHLGLSAPKAKPPPLVREIVRVPVDNAGHEIASPRAHLSAVDDHQRGA